MNRFRQHIPTFVDADIPDWIEFETTEEILLIDSVKNWAKPMGGKEFSHFAMSDNCLMVIHDNGFHWWVVGYIEKPDEINLPKWDGGKYRVQLSNGKKVILNDKEIGSSCGDVLTLTDGSTAKNLK